MNIVKNEKIKYFKNLISDWTQPVLSSNGEVGISDFAVWATGARSAGPAYRAFDNVSGHAWVSNVTSKPCVYGFYSKTPLNISKLTWQNNNGRNYNITGGTFQGSNDYANWTDLATIDYNTTPSAIRTFNISSTEYYKYFRFYITSSYNSSETGNECYIGYIQITATQCVTVESNPQQFDFTNTIMTYNCIKNKVLK